MTPGREAPRGAAPDAAEELYDTEGAAVYLNVSAGHVRKLVTKGKLKSSGKGRALRFTQATLDRYKQRRRSVGRPIGSGEIFRSAKERRWWREYMRKRRLKAASEKAASRKGAKKGAKKQAKGRKAAGAAATSKKASRKRGARAVAAVKGTAGGKKSAGGKSGKG